MPILCITFIRLDVLFHFLWGILCILQYVASLNLMYLLFLEFSSMWESNVYVYAITEHHIPNNYEGK